MIRRRESAVRGCSSPPTGTARPWGRVVPSLLRLAAGLGGALALAAGLTTTPVLAHASLISTSPGNGADLVAAPDAILLQFDVPVNARLSTVTLANDRGRNVTGLAVDTPAGASSTLVVQLPRLPQGVYRLDFRARDDTDLHETRGAIVFGVARAVDLAGQPATSPMPSYVETGSRWMDLAGTCLLVGVVTVWLGILPAVGRRRRVTRAARTRLLCLAGLGCGAILLGRAGQLWVTAASLAAGLRAGWPAEAWSALSTSWFGLLWLAGVAIAGLAILAARTALAREGSRWAGAALIAVTAAAVTVSSWSSHGDNRAGVDLVLLATRAVHLGAAGLWVGGLTVLVFLFAGTLRGGSPEAPAALAAFRRFTGLAFFAVALLTVSGLVLATRGLGSPAALLSTAYGLTLIAKMMAGIAAVGLGIRHTLLLSPPRGAGVSGPVRLARSVPFELGTMLIVLWAAASLGATAPAPASGDPYAVLLSSHAAPAVETVVALAALAVLGAWLVVAGRRRRAQSRAAAAAFVQGERPPTPLA